MVQASRDLWVESQGGRVRVENVLSGLEVVVEPRELELSGTPDSRSVFCGKSAENIGSHVIRAVDRLTTAHCGAEPPPDALERLTLCRTRCLEALEPDSEAHRDLKALFQTAEYLLREDTDREFNYLSGLLSTMWRRPNLEYGFGQLPCMPETTQRRVAQAEPFLAPDSRGLILGDDDLMGLCWGLMYDQPCDVFELDQRLLDFYQSCATEGLAYHQRDLTRGLPTEFHGLYDVIFTDPMYGKAGMDMFLKCCAQGLSKSPRARLFLNTRPDLIEEGDRLTERLANLGLHISKRTPGFSRYRFPDETRRLALDSLRATHLPRSFLRGLLKVPYYYSDLLEVVRIS
jgi:hypothetical protein